MIGIASLNSHHRLNKPRHFSINHLIIVNSKVDSQEDEAPIPRKFTRDNPRRVLAKPSLKQPKRSRMTMSNKMAANCEKIDTNKLVLDASKRTDPTWILPRMST